MQKLAQSVQERRVAPRWVELRRMRKDVGPPPLMEAVGRLAHSTGGTETERLQGSKSEESTLSMV